MSHGHAGQGKVIAIDYVIQTRALLKKTVWPIHFSFSFDILKF